MSETIFQHAALTHPQMKMLEHVFDAPEHQIDFDQRRYRPDALAMVKAMIEKGVVKVYELVQHHLSESGRIVLRCTEKGCKIVDALKQAKAEPRIVTA